MPSAPHDLAPPSACRDGRGGDRTPVPPGCPDDNVAIFDCHSAPVQADRYWLCARTWALRSSGSRPVVHNAARRQPVRHWRRGDRPANSGRMTITACRFSDFGSLPRLTERAVKQPVHMRDGIARGTDLVDPMQPDGRGVVSSHCPRDRDVQGLAAQQTKRCTSMKHENGSLCASVWPTSREGNE